MSETKDQDDAIARMTLLADMAEVRAKQDIVRELEWRDRLLERLAYSRPIQLPPIVYLNVS